MFFTLHFFSIQFFRRPQDYTPHLASQRSVCLPSFVFFFVLSSASHSLAQKPTINNSFCQKPLDTFLHLSPKNAEKYAGYLRRIADFSSIYLDFQIFFISL